MAVQPPNIPALSSKVDTEVKRAFESLKGWLNKVGNHGGMVTTGSLPGDLSTGPLGGFFDGTVPPQLQNLVVTGAFSSIMLQWDDPRYLNLAYVEAWRNTEDDPGAAQLIVTTKSTMCTDTPPNASIFVTYYYWVRAVSTSGIVGPFNATAGTTGNTATDPAYALEILSGQITGSELHADLNARIDVSSVLAATATALDNNSGEAMLINILTQSSTIQKAIDEEKARAAAITAEAFDRAEGLANEAIDRANQIASISELLTGANSLEAATRTEALAMLDGVIGEAGLLHTLTQVAAIQQTVTEEISRGAAIAGEAQDRARAILDEQEARGIVIAEEASERNILASKLLGEDGTSFNSGLIYNERHTSSNAIQSVSQQISLLTAGVEGGFDPYQTYYFDTTAEGWTGTDCTILASTGWVEQTAVSASPAILEKSGLELQGSKYATVKFRIKRLSGTGWGISVDYQTSSGWNIGKDVTEETVVVGDTATLTVDFSDVSAWTGNTITGIRIKTSATTADRFSFDWIATGRQAPAVSVAAFQSEQQARADADSAEVESRETLSVKLVGRKDPSTLTIDTISTGLLFDEKHARVTESAAQVERIQGLEATINNIDTGVAATASALDTIKLTVNNSENGVVALGGRLQVVESYVSDPDSNALALVSVEQKTRADADSAMTDEIHTTASTFGPSGEALLSAIVAGDLRQKTSSAFIIEEQHTRATALEAEATERETIKARVADSEAAIVAEQHTRADAISAEAGARTTMAATILGPDGTGMSAGVIYEAKNILVEANSAIATRVSDLSIVVNDNRAANIRDTEEAGANLERAFTDEKHSSSAIFGPLGEALLTNIVAGATGVKTTMALIQTEQHTRATALEAEATERETIKARIGDTESAITEVNTVAADSDSAIARQVFGMDVTVGNHTASIGAINDISADSTSASARALAVVQAEINDPVHGALALITNEAITRVDAGKALTDEAHVTMSLFGPTGETLLANIVAGNAMKDITSAFIREEQHTRATELEAEATRLESLVVKLVNDAGIAVAALIELQQKTFADATTAEAVQRELLSARIGTAEGVIINEQRVRATSINSEAVSRQTLAATVAGQSTAIAVEQEVRATSIAPVYAKNTAYAANKCAMYGTPLKLYRNKTGATINDPSWTAGHWTEIPADLYGQYTVKVDVNGKIGGYGLSNDGTTSRMIISVDEFGVERPVQFTGSNTPLGAIEGNEWAKADGTVWKLTSGAWVQQEGHAVPIAVLTTSQVINGVTLPPGVYIDGASITHETIGSSQIKGLAADKLTVPDTATIWEAIINDGKITNPYIGDFICSTSYNGSTSLSITPQWSGSITYNIGDTVKFFNQQTGQIGYYRCTATNVNVPCGYIASQHHSYWWGGGYYTYTFVINTPYWEATVVNDSFSTGTQGWCISKQGWAVFNKLTVRTSLVGYRWLGNVPVTLAATASDFNGLGIVERIFDIEVRNKTVTININFRAPMTGTLYFRFGYHSSGGADAFIEYPILISAGTALSSQTLSFDVPTYDGIVKLDFHRFHPNLAVAAGNYTFEWDLTILAISEHATEVCAVTYGGSTPISTGTVSMPSLSSLVA